MRKGCVQPGIAADALRAQLNAALGTDMSHITILVGAGATVSDAMNRSIKHRPPLDRGFFRAASSAKTSGLAPVREYMASQYGIDPTKGEHDSLESVMATLYSDIYNPSLAQNQAGESFRALLRVLVRRLASTTNSLEPSPQSNLYRILRKLLRGGVRPENITIITFNQDLQIERTLHAIQSAKVWSDLRVFEFPHCYRLPDVPVTTPTAGDAPVFPVSELLTDGVEVLKLHGSLNWFSRHTSREPSPRSLLNPRRALTITTRSTVRAELTTKGKRVVYMYPVVVPPVVHKAAILHEHLAPVWQRAQEALAFTNHLIAFGYSCPPSDHESANLLRSALRNSQDLKTVSVIDPSPITLQRYVELTSFDRIYFYRSAKAYLEGA